MDSNNNLVRFLLTFFLGWIGSVIINHTGLKPEGFRSRSLAYFFLTIITCGIYGWIWLYKAGELVNRAKANRGMMIDSNSSILYLVLGLFGLQLISWCLIQNELNKMA